MPAPDHTVAIVAPRARWHALQPLAACLGPTRVTWHTWREARATPTLAPALGELADDDESRAAAVFMASEMAGSVHAVAAWLEDCHGALPPAVLLTRLAGLFQCPAYVPQLWRATEPCCPAPDGLRITLKHALIVPRWVSVHRWPHDAYFLSKLQRYPCVLARARLHFDPTARDEDVPCITNSRGERLVGVAACLQWLKSLRAVTALA